MKKIIFFFICGVSLNFGQVKFCASFEGNYLFYNVSEFEKINKVICDRLCFDSGFPFEIEENFDHRISYSFKISRNISSPFKNNFLYIGGNLSFHSNASRVAYSDYSGHVYYDQLLNFTSFGAFLLGKQKNSDFFGMEVLLMINYVSSSYSHESSTKIINYTEEADEIEFVSSSAAFDFAFRPYFLWKDFQVGLNFAYSIYLPSELKLKDRDEGYLTRDGKKVELNLSGANIGLFLSYNFNLDEN